MIRILRVVAAAAVTAALAITGPAAAVPATAATPSVTMVARTTYDVLPAENRVAATVAITATSHLQDTVTRHYYSTQAYLAVPPTASSFHLSAATGSPSVAVSSRSTAGIVLLLRFGSQLGSGKTLAMTLTFDIVDAGGIPERPLRISPSLVSFQAWALGSDAVAGSTVRVHLPAGYAAVVGRGPLTGPTSEADGSLDFDSSALPSPTSFVADVQADRPGDLVAATSPVEVGGSSVDLVVRSWPDDPAWRARINDLLVPGLPKLGAAIGRPWPLGSRLEVRETLARAASGSGDGGDAATFDPALAQLDVSYLANETSILLGVAHAWFNGDLVADRWIADGFATLYAERTGLALGVNVASPTITQASLAYAGPLNAWVPGGPADQYAEPAALDAARQIVREAGDQALRQVWQDAANGVGAYQPETGAGPIAGSGITSGVPAASPGAASPGAASPGASRSVVGSAATTTSGVPEAATGPLDWRSLLDLLEAHATGDFETIWRTWIARPADQALLGARTAARSHYDDVVQAAGDWVLPRSIRNTMRAWQFQEANIELDAAADVLRQRTELEAAAVSDGLALPARLRIAFEGSEGMAAAAAEAVTEMAVITKYADAAALRPVDPDIPTRIGLLGTTPDVDLERARAAFASGDLDGTLTAAAAARAIWEAAPGVARGRIFGGLGLALAFALLVYLVRARWRRRGVLMHAHRHRG